MDGETDAQTASGEFWLLSRKPMGTYLLGGGKAGGAQILREH